MNCCAHTASTERRELSRIAAWIRASRCLAQNRSEATAVGNWPSVATRHPSTEPSASRRATAERSSPTVPVPIEADSSSRVTGPSTSRWPRAAATNASSREQGTACAVGIEASSAYELGGELPALGGHPPRAGGGKLDGHGPAGMR